MGWKTRGGQSYFYESERVGGRVVSTYHGRDELAHSIAEFEILYRQARKAESNIEWAKREDVKRIAKRIARACRTLTVAAEAVLESSGYHRHHRGPWRRRRTMSVEALSAPTCGVLEVAPPSLAERYRSGDEAARKEVRGMIAKAEKGNRDAARELGKLMRAAPEIASLTASDITHAVEVTLIRRLFGEDALATAEAVHVKLRTLRAELGGPNPSAVERLLAERVALCWLDCQYAEFKEISAKPKTLAQADFTARQGDRSHRRYLASLKALAAVRKIPIVAVQVNMGASALPCGGG